MSVRPAQALDMKERECEKREARLPAPMRRSSENPRRHGRCGNRTSRPHCRPARMQAPGTRPDAPACAIGNSQPTALSTAAGTCLRRVLRG